jgi:DNA-binding XRE family transcriptional regulator
MIDYRITLPLLKTYRSRILTHRTIEDITTARAARDPHAPALTAERLKQLENQPQHEPWYDEARDLARLLLLDRITPLITPGHIGDLSHILGPLQDTDMQALREGWRLPLSVACRITLALGLDDPIQLEQDQHLVEAWVMMASNERGAGPGECPWCLAHTSPVTNDLPAHLFEPVALEPHKSTCFVNGMLAARSTAPYLAAGAPVPAGPRTRGDARKAGGIKNLRKAKSVTQRKLAEDIGVHWNYYSRIERGEMPMTVQLAEKAARKLGCTVADIFA